VLRTLADRHYDGPVSVAPDRAQFGTQARDAIVKQAAASLDRVWKAAGLNAAGKFAEPVETKAASGRQGAAGHRR
jgi:hypothetical protein